MDTSQWAQGIGVVKQMENPCSKQAPMLERRARPQKDQALNCPRCNSTNTKFCYYNNYSLSQPRYFCKTCRRYWTEGGSLRNVPVGGGSRKNKTTTTSSTSSKNLPQTLLSQQNHKIHHEEQKQDLNLRSCGNITDLVQQNNNKSSVSSSTSTTTTTIDPTSAASTSHHNLSALELLTGITTSSRGLQYSFMPLVQGDNSNTVYNNNCGFPLQDFKQVPMNFSLDGIGGSEFASVDHHGVEESSEGRVLFPFEDLKHVSSTNLTLDQNNIKDQQGYSSGFWTGMLGGGGEGGSW